jgi:hypothetical protein
MKIIKGPLFLQIKSIKNVAKPANRQESGNQRILVINLTDGQNHIQAIEQENIPGLRWERKQRRNHLNAIFSV